MEFTWDWSIANHFTDAKHRKQFTFTSKQITWQRVHSWCMLSVAFVLSLFIFSVKLIDWLRWMASGMLWDANLKCNCVTLKSRSACLQCLWATPMPVIKPSAALKHSLITLFRCQLTSKTDVPLEIHHRPLPNGECKSMNYSKRFDVETTNRQWLVPRHTCHSTILVHRSTESANFFSFFRHGCALHGSSS